MFPINRNRPRPATICFLLTLCLTAWSAFGRPSPQPTPTQAAVSQQSKSLAASVAMPNARIQPICETQLGWRTLGKNPLREQVETIDPDPETWRKISLEMRKEDGLRLWIELLRSLDWIADYEAIPRQTIFLDLEEMGAVGDAEVTAIEPCPPIQRGPGGLVTGIFKHESNGKNVVLLRIEGQEEPTGVTSNHSYWSEDRQDYVPVGELRERELLDTEFGHRRVVSVAPHPNYTGLLYNLETTEHVYRVGPLGTLAHNTCVSTGTALLPFSKVRAFANIKLFKEHYLKHVVKNREWGAVISETGYFNRAKKLLSGPAGPHVQEYRRINGDLVRVNVRTGEYGIVTQDGTVRTIFRPEPNLDKGITDALSYFLKDRLNHLGY